MLNNGLKYQYVNIIISVILCKEGEMGMTFIEEVVFSGFVSKAVNNIVDVSWTKMKKAVKERSTKYQNLESQIYNVIIDVLNRITNNLYEDNQDKIYDAAEVLLESFKKNEKDESESIKICLRVLDSPADENECLKFKVSLYEGLGKDDYSELFHAILLLLLDQKSRCDNAVYKQLNQKLDEVILILNRKKDDVENSNIKQKVKSRTQEYLDKWNANMFLNDFDKRDENAGVNVKLSQVYLDEHLPHYVWKDNENSHNDLKDLLSEYINDGNKSKMLLILGQPGIGKSTLITWIIANFIRRMDDVLVFQFAFDFKYIEWQDCGGNHYFMDDLLLALNLTYHDLDGKILILDGFDEISVDNRIEVLEVFFWRLAKNKLLNNFSLIITCRENYVHDLHRLECGYITLQAWDREQIESFCKKYQEVTDSIITEDAMANILMNKSILGIPLILYMVLGLNILIEKYIDYL